MSKLVVIWHKNSTVSYFHGCSEVKELANHISFVYYDDKLKKNIRATFLYENITGYGLGYENN